MCETPHQKHAHNSVRVSKKVSIIQMTESARVVIKSRGDYERCDFINEIEGCMFY